MYEWNNIYAQKQQSSKEFRSFYIASYVKLYVKAQYAYAYIAVRNVSKAQHQLNKEMITSIYKKEQLLSLMVYKAFV